MPHNPIRVVVGPANYFSHPGSLNHLHDFSLMNSFLARCGSTANAPLQRRKQNFRQRLNGGAKHILFRGHCSESGVQQLAADSGDDRSVVIGVGGGALLDTAKPSPAVSVCRLLPFRR